MGVLKDIKISIDKIGIKEVARRTGLAPSTVSRISSGKISPSLEAIEKISEALGYQLQMHPVNIELKAPKLQSAMILLRRLRKELKQLGVVHATVFGSVARGEDTDSSDIDIYLDYGDLRPKIGERLRAEGMVLDTLSGSRVDIVSDLDSAKGKRLLAQILKDGVRVF